VCVCVWVGGCVFVAGDVSGCGVVAALAGGCA